MKYLFLVLCIFSAIDAIWTISDSRNTATVTATNSFSTAAITEAAKDLSTSAVTETTRSTSSSISDRNNPPVISNCPTDTLHLTAQVLNSSDILTLDVGVSAADPDGDTLANPVLVDYGTSVALRFVNLTLDSRGNLYLLLPANINVSNVALKLSVRIEDSKGASSAECDFGVNIDINGSSSGNNRPPVILNSCQNNAINLTTQRNDSSKVLLLDLGVSATDPDGDSLVGPVFKYDSSQTLQFINLTLDARGNFYLLLAVAERVTQVKIIISMEIRDSNGASSGSCELTLFISINTSSNGNTGGDGSSSGSDSSGGGSDGSSGDGSSGDGSSSSGGGGGNGSSGGGGSDGNSGGGGSDGSGSSGGGGSSDGGSSGGSNGNSGSGNGSSGGGGGGGNGNSGGGSNGNSGGGSNGSGGGSSGNGSGEGNSGGGGNGSSGDGGNGNSGDGGNGNSGGGNGSGGGSSGGGGNGSGGGGGSSGGGGNGNSGDGGNGSGGGGNGSGGGGNGNSGGGGSDGNSGDGSNGSSGGGGNGSGGGSSGGGDDGSSGGGGSGDRNGSNNGSSNGGGGGMSGNGGNTSSCPNRAHPKLLTILQAFASVNITFNINQSQVVLKSLKIKTAIAELMTVFCANHCGFCSMTSECVTFFHNCLPIGSGNVIILNVGVTTSRFIISLFGNRATAQVTLAVRLPTNAPLLTSTTQPLVPPKAVLTALLNNLAWLMAKTKMVIYSMDFAASSRSDSTACGESNDLRDTVLLSVIVAVLICILVGGILIIAIFKYCYDRKKNKININNTQQGQQGRVGVVSLTTVAPAIIESTFIQHH